MTKERVAVSDGSQLMSMKEWYPVLVPHKYGYWPYVPGAPVVGTFGLSVVTIVNLSVEHWPVVAAAPPRAIGPSSTN